MTDANSRDKSPRPELGYGPNNGGKFSRAALSGSIRYRGVKNIRTPVFMNKADMQARGLCQYDLVDIPIGDFSTQSDQPSMKHLPVEVTARSAISAEKS